MSTRFAISITAAVTILAFGAGCGSSSKSATSSSHKQATDASPPGDIPDNQAFVAYTPPGGGYLVKVPEGWSRTSSGAAVTFVDKLNSVELQSATAAAQPSAAATRRQVPRSATAVRVGTVTRHAGQATRVTYTVPGKPDPVTGRTRPAAVERYVFFRNGRLAIVTLTGAKGSDNVDPWHTITDSVRWTR